VWETWVRACASVFRPQLTYRGIRDHAHVHSTTDRQKDIEFGNSYRLEYIKHLITISSGMFAFTVVFMKDFVGRTVSSSHGQVILVFGWVSLIVSIVAGIYHMRYWAWFFNSWSTHPDDGKARRETIDRRRRTAEAVQFFAFFIGLGCLFCFAALNLWSTTDRPATIAP
jgi:hypothetical protein